MQRDREQQLHDYVDGRLSAVEREEFEAAMTRDASLAAKVATYRAMGDALRDGEDQLGEAFYAGARERFENSRRSWIERLWSWEAASLLAAAALAFALFLPMIFENGLPDEANGSAAVMTELDRVAPRTDTGEAALEGSPAEVDRQFATERLVDEAAAGIADDAEAKPVPPAPALKTPAVVTDAPRASAPVAKKAAAGKAEVRETELREEQAPAEPRVISESLKSVSPAASMGRRRDLRLPVVRMPLAPPAPITLPALEEWRRMVDDPDFPTLAALGTPTADDRLLWVGDSLDCDRLTATVEAGAWRLVLHPGDDVACALRIPADGLPVTAAKKTAP